MNIVLCWMSSWLTVIYFSRWRNHIVRVSSALTFDLSPSAVRVSECACHVTLFPWSWVCRSGVFLALPQGDQLLMLMNRPPMSYSCLQHEYDMGSLDCRPQGAFCM